MCFGVECLPNGKRKDKLGAAITRIFEQKLADKTLSFDREAAYYHCACIQAHRRSLGRPIGAEDSQIAAIARAHNAIVATRNSKDFADCRIKVVNPFAVQ
jgi:predicted nucleic acid-binding protein